MKTVRCFPMKIHGISESYSWVPTGPLRVCESQAALTAPRTQPGLGGHPEHKSFLNEESKYLSRVHPGLQSDPKMEN